MGDGGQVACLGAGDGGQACPGFGARLFAVAEHGKSVRAALRHGTAYCYKHGCRRPECREAARVARKAIRDRSRAANSPGYQRELAASRALKEGYRGVCENCGAATTGCDGPGTARKLCKLCAPAANARRTPEHLIDAILAWTSRFGAPPTASQWNPAFARSYVRLNPNSAIARRNAELAQLVVDEDWPRASTVAWRFGSWKAGIAAAGLETTRPGPRAVAG